MANHVNHTLDEALSVGDKIEQLMVRVLSIRKLTQNEEFELFMSAMALRCLNFLRATLLLSRAGLGQPVSGCVRSLIEQRWVFEAVAAKDTRDEALKRLHEQDEYNRKKACENLRNLDSSERDQSITEEALSQIEASLGKTNNHHLSNWAKLAKRSSEYLATYALLCTRIHPSSLAIESHLLFDDSARIQTVTANPDLDSLPRDILQACEIMIDVIASSPDTWQTEDVVIEATELRKRLHKLWQRI